MDSERKNGCLLWLLSGVIFVCINCICVVLFEVPLREIFIGKSSAHGFGTSIVSVVAGYFITGIVFTFCLLFSSILLSMFAKKNNQKTSESKTSLGEEQSSKDTSNDSHSNS